MKGETGTCVASDLQPSGEQAERGQGLNVVVIQVARVEIVEYRLADVAQDVSGCDFPDACGDLRRETDKF